MSTELDSSILSRAIATGKYSDNQLRLLQQLLQNYQQLGWNLNDINDSMLDWTEKQLQEQVEDTNAELYLNRRKSKFKSGYEQEQKRKHREEKDKEILDMFGLPYNRKGVDVNRDTLYGFAYMTELDNQEWRFHSGSFEYLYGAFESILNVHEALEMLQSPEDLNNQFINFVFFELDTESFQPISVFSEARIDETIARFMQKGHPFGTQPVRVELRDLIFIENTNVTFYPFN